MIDRDQQHRLHTDIAITFMDKLHQYLPLYNDIYQLQPDDESNNGLYTFE